VTFGLVVVFLAASGLSATRTVAGSTDTPMVHHCMLGSALGTEWYWVPELIVNAPYAGSATGTVGTTIASDISVSLPGLSWEQQSASTTATTMSISNGQSVGNFELTQWTIYSDYNLSDEHLPATPCTTPYLTQVTDWTGWAQSAYLTNGAQWMTSLPHSISLTDNDPQTRVYGQSIPSVGGIDSFGWSSNNQGGQGTCNGPGVDYSVTQATLASTSLGLNHGVGYSWMSVNIGAVYQVVTGSSTSFTYSFPLNGNWLYDSLTGGSGGELAFYYTPCGGGGGCVASGTPILTAAGYVPVQQIRPGTLVQEYDFSTSSMTQGTFLSANVTHVHAIVNVNHGELRLTATDQPVYVRNATFTGWLRDPQNLTTADHLFDPVNGSWIQIWSVTLQKVGVDVYDVVTSGANNYIANGVLLDQKKP